MKQDSLTSSFIKSNNLASLQNDGWLSFKRVEIFNLSDTPVQLGSFVLLSS